MRALAPEAEVTLCGCLGGCGEQANVVAGGRVVRSSQALACQLAPAAHGALLRLEISFFRQSIEAGILLSTNYPTGLLGKKQ